MHDAHIETENCSQSRVRDDSKMVMAVGGGGGGECNRGKQHVTGFQLDVERVGAQVGAALH